VLIAAGLSGCAQPMHADDHMFEHWANAVAAIQVDENSPAGAPAKSAAKSPSQPNAQPKPQSQATDATTPSLGKQAAMQIDVIERTALVDAKTAGLRETVSIVDSQFAGLRRQMGLEPGSAPTATAVADTRVQRPASSLAGGFVAQLAAFPNRVAAEAGWARLKAAHPQALAALRIAFRPVDLGSRGVWVRLQTAAFSTRAEAAAVCGRVGVAEKTCVLPVDPAARA
jgi:hypothetical protein